MIRFEFHFSDGSQLARRVEEDPGYADGFLEFAISDHEIHLVNLAQVKWFSRAELVPEKSAHE